MSHSVAVRGMAQLVVDDKVVAEAVPLEIVATDVDFSTLAVEGHAAVVEIPLPQSMMVRLPYGAFLPVLTADLLSEAEEVSRGGSL